jgi:hypothetical protein
MRNVVHLLRVWRLLPLMCATMLLTSCNNALALLLEGQGTYHNPLQSLTSMATSVSISSCTICATRIVHRLQRRHALAIRGTVALQPADAGSERIGAGCRLRRSIRWRSDLLVYTGHT